MEGYSDEKSPKSPAYYRSRLTSVLKGDDAWAGRDKEIREGRQNTSVKSDTYKEFVNLKPSKPKNQLLVEFREGMERLRAARTGSARIDEEVPRLPTISEADDEETTSLLRKIIQSPELSERELFLLELVENGQGDKVSAIAEDFGCDEVTRCPHCLQKVTEEYKRGLVQSVSKVLSKTVEEHKESLRQCLIGTVEQDRLDLSAFRDLEGYGTCDTLLKVLNTAIREHDDLVNKKIGNPYEPVIEAPQPIGPLVAQVRASLASLEDERVDFNNKVTDVSSIEEELRGINAEIAHYDVRDFATQLKIQETEKGSLRKRLEEARTVQSHKEKLVEDIEAEKRSVKIAAESINSCMSYIFFSKDRLQIVLENGEYRLRSRGRSVRPSEVSVGERNILALSYFFTSILEGKEAGSYDDECLIVLDDPVSSYDLGNKVGILSFLSFELGRFLGSNERTRVLVMTHDLGTMFDMEATLSDMKDSIKSQGSSVDVTYELLELADGQVGRFLYRKRHEYTELVGAVYDYACGMPSPHELAIGNMMRQMLEAYARFVHGCGIEAVSTNEEILTTLPGKEYQSSGSRRTVREEAAEAGTLTRL